LVSRQVLLRDGHVSFMGKMLIVVR